MVWIRDDAGDTKEAAGDLRPSDGESWREGLEAAVV